MLPACLGVLSNIRETVKCFGRPSTVDQSKIWSTKAPADCRWGKENQETDVSATKISDYDAIAKTVQHYLDGAKAGKGELMKPAFHKEAAIYGYVGSDLWAGPIQSLYDWTDKTGPSKDIVGKIVTIDIAETIASVRVESDNWASYRFSDFFTLLKVDGQWKIMNKVFHLHG
jgi:hypothetical protein